MESVLKKYFGFSTFRPYQKEIVEQILEGRDCLVVMATGSGKSICYQVPPLVAKKTAIVISPLISLMQDQVMALKQRGIKADYLSSAQSDSTVPKKAERGEYDILYMTPEKACVLPPSFWSRLLISGISLLAVDEAHCISEWGHDFRVEYKRLDKLRDVLSNVPFVGLTATATEKVRKDIINSLKLKDTHVAIGSFDRQNLFYGVKSFNSGSSFLDKLVEEISKYVENACSTIIYCTTINDVEQISKSLHQAGIRVGMYHGQMANKAREESHRSFIRDEFLVMVATVAFGMGIDKPNIRYVIHYGCPKSLESYYQESGRCGRDGIASVCYLYFRRSDFAKADYYCGEAQSAEQRTAIMESFMAAQRYCMLTSCRRSYLLNYFGGNNGSDNCGNCDNCTNERKENDMSRESFLLMGCIQSCGGHYGLNLPVDVLRGSRSKKILDAKLDKLPFHGLGKNLSANWWKALAHQLISGDYLVETFRDVYKTISVSSNGLKFLSSCTPDHQPPLYLVVTSEMTGDEENKEAGEQAEELSASAGSHRFSQAEEELYKMLLNERTNLARARGTAPYAICGDQTLQKIALTRPSTKARLANIDGVNQHLMKMYGDHFLQCIQLLSQQLNLSMDGESCTQSPLVRKVASKVEKLTPAKFEAWKMWQEDGFTIQRIANYPGRSAPIKEQTVIEYLLEAVRDGQPLDWPRFCGEIGLSKEVFSNIQQAISKVGREKLKPIKTELPEEVTYPQIKASLLMQELGIEVNSSSHPLSYEDHRGSNVNNDQHERSDGLFQTEEKYHTTESLMSTGGVVSSRDKNEAAVPEINRSNITERFAPCNNDLFIVNKRRKSNELESEMVNLREATGSSILSWLENFGNGVAFADILTHFNGSTEESVTKLLTELEGEFSIYKKNFLYKVM